MSKAPRAIRLGHPGQEEVSAEGTIRRGDVAILPESEPIDAVEPVVAPAARPPVRTRWFITCRASLSRPSVPGRPA